MFIEFLKQFAITIGGATVVVGAVAWLARSIITQWLSKNVEAYKANLKAESDLALERLRTELQIMAARRNIEYSRIHEKRLEIISGLAGKIDAFTACVVDYVSPVEWKGGSSKEERRKLAADAFAKFNEYFRPRRFFLPKHIVTKIEQFRAGLYNISVEFMYYVEQGREFRNKDVDVWDKATDYTSKEAPKILAELEDDFRKILGVEEG